MFERINHIIPDFLLKPQYRLYRHLLIQAILLLITVNVLWDEPDKILPERLGGWLAYYFQIGVVIYVNMYLLVPKFLIKGKILLYIVFLPLIILFTAFSVGLLQQVYSESISDHNTPLFFESIVSIAAFSTFTLGLTTIMLFKYLLENSRKINELENTTMAIELANLQSQINPHFLFNTLNNANILAQEDAERSSYILKKLNDLLRYQTEGERKGSVCLIDEIAFINDYLNLEKTRRDRFEYKISQVGNCNINVPPLLFIPFVENAVKHNPENDSSVEIVFRRIGNNLYFECKNPKAKFPHLNKTGGIGLVNVKKRLNLLFGKEYNLEIQDDKEFYTIKMEIIINF